MSEQDMQVVFLKSYDGESLYDVSRDVGESFEAGYNPIMKTIPVDEHGFQKGRFTVSVLWHGENNG